MKQNDSRTERPLSAMRLGLAFAGCFLGAGYVSGREMWSFFGRYGNWGWLGLALAMLTLGALGGITLLLVRRSGEERLSHLVLPWDHPAARAAVSGFSVIFLIGIDCIMTAGAGALLRQIFHFPHWLGSLIFSLGTAVLTLTGLSGMLTVFSLAVPLLTAAAMIFCLWGTLKLPVPAQETVPAGKGWLAAAVAFASYNMFSSVAILSPMGKMVCRKIVGRGIAIGLLLLLAIAAPILLFLQRHRMFADEELPMLSAAQALSPAAGYFFALLLLIAMLGTALSCFLTAINDLCRFSKRIRVRRTFCIFLFSGLQWAASLFGFGALIDFIYPVFGGVSVLFLLLLCIHFFMIKNE